MKRNRLVKMFLESFQSRGRDSKAPPPDTPESHISSALKLYGVNKSSGVKITHEPQSDGSHKTHLEYKAKSHDKVGRAISVLRGGAGHGGEGHDLNSKTSTKAEFAHRGPSSIHTTHSEENGIHKVSIHMKSGSA